MKIKKKSLPTLKNFRELLSRVKINFKADPVYRVIVENGDAGYYQTRIQELIQQIQASKNCDTPHSKQLLNKAFTTQTYLMIARLALLAILQNESESA